MQSKFTSRLGYLAVFVVLGLVWFEFLASQFRKTQPENAASFVGTATATSPLAQTAATTTTPATTAATLPASPPMDPFTRLLKEPPPISINLQNATLAQAVAALKDALGTDAAISINGNQAAANRVVNLEMKNQPFWEIFKSLQLQAPFSLQANSRGFILGQGNFPIRQFEQRGAVIFYPSFFSYVRDGTGQSRPDDPSSARLTLTLNAAIDPRLHVLRRSAILVTDAVDNTGQVFKSTANTSLPFINSEANCWSTTTTWIAPEKFGKSLSIKAVFRFTAQNGDATVTLDDAQTKLDQPFDFGDRRLNLVRCELLNNRLNVQFAAPDADPLPAGISFTVTDATGTAQPTVQGLTGTMAVGNGPYKITVKGPNTKDITMAFELADLSIP